MRLRAIIILILGICIALGFWVLHTLYLNHNVQLHILGKVIETPLSMLLIGLVALSFVLFVFLKLLSLVIFFPSHLRAWKRHWAEKRRTKTLADGLHAMVLGIKPIQHKTFLAAADAGVAPAATYLLAAASTTDTKRQANLLRKAAKAEGDPMVKAMATAQARLLANQPAEAAEVLRIAGAATHKAVQPMKLLLEANEKSGDIRGALDVATHLLDRDPSPSLRHRIGQLTGKLLADAGNADDVRGLLGNVQKSGTSPNMIAIAAAERMAAVNDKNGASSVLSQALKQGADAELLSAISRFGTEELVRQALSESESMLEKKPQESALLRAVGQLSIREKLWGQAHKMLEQALTIKEERETYLQMARLAEAEGKSTDEINRLYRQAAQTEQTD